MSCKRTLTSILRVYCSYQMKSSCYLDWNIIYLSEIYFKCFSFILERWTFMLLGYCPYHFGFHVDVIKGSVGFKMTSNKLIHEWKIKSDREEFPSRYFLQSCCRTKWRRVHVISWISYAGCWGLKQWSFLCQQVTRQFAQLLTEKLVHEREDRYGQGMQCKTLRVSVYNWPQKCLKILKKVVRWAYGMYSLPRLRPMYFLLSTHWTKHYL